MICVLQGIPACSISRFCYWTRPFDIFNFTVPPIWQVHCTTGLMCTLRFKASLHSQEKRYILSFMHFICLQQPFFYMSLEVCKKETQPNLQYSVWQLVLGHLIIISVNAFYYAVCVLMSRPFSHFTNYLFVEWICTRSSVILVLIMIYSVH